MTDTIQRVCKAYCTARAAHRRPWLRWRGRKSLGWIPFNSEHVTFDGRAFRFRGQRFEAMHTRENMVAGVKIFAGSFNADAKGHWYINVPIEELASAPASSGSIVGIDLGLKALATFSDGRTLAMPSFFKASELTLVVAQRARKSKRVRAIHAKIANRRRDYLHKASASITREYGTIVVGDASPSKLAKTQMAKSIYDAGWASFKRMLSYKAIRHGGRYVEASEAMSTQTCSMCGCLPPSRPKGIAGLGIREWTCDDCGTVHDRDVNAARNILRVGLDTLAEGARS